ncbi:hypothetical protein Vafri_13869 [Volvox africanus]|uniref:Uncharacterized protein n=1 Tax=Volvox africanus TaxID=51714 RepID=A0A8J4F4D8_9CHLO|nr:hypothetical protein Vafri_13869 [Volvox africanus]
MEDRMASKIDALDLDQQVLALRQQQQGSASPSPTPPKHLHDDRLLFEVPEEKVAQTAELIGDSLRTTHLGAVIRHDVVPRRPWQAQNGAAEVRQPDGFP